MLLKMLLDAYRGEVKERLVFREEFIKLMKIINRQITDSELMNCFSQLTKKSPNNSREPTSDVNPDAQSTEQNLNIKLDLSLLDNRLDTYLKAQESLGSLLNAKAIKQRFAEFHLKMKVWKQRNRIRERMKRKNEKISEKLTKAFEKATNDFTVDQDRVQEVNDLYTEFREELMTSIKQEKVLNNFLTNVPETSAMIDVEDLQRIIQKEKTLHTEKKDQLNSLVAKIKTECFMEGGMFTFYNIPDVIVKINPSKKNFEMMSKLLVKIKDDFLAQKAAHYEMLLAEEPANTDDMTPQERKKINMNRDSMLSQKKAELTVITDEDLASITLLDDFMANFDHKFQKKIDIYQQFIETSNIAADRRMKQLMEQKELGADMQKRKKQIEQSTFADILNKELEKQHEKVTTLYFKH